MPNKSLFAEHFDDDNPSLYSSVRTMKTLESFEMDGVLLQLPKEEQNTIGIVYWLVYSLKFLLQLYYKK